MLFRHKSILAATRKATIMDKSSYLTVVAMTIAFSISSLNAQIPASIERTKFSLTVENGNPSGNYAAGARVVVSADTPKGGAKFTGWTGDVAILTNPSLATTTATIPFMAVTITANYTAAANSSAALGVSTPTAPTTKSRSSLGRGWEG
jgi:hypothetical protein